MYRVYQEGYKSLTVSTFKHRDVARGYANALRDMRPGCRVVVERVR
jgi:hypothetical protein